MKEKWHTLLCMSIFFCNFAAELCARVRRARLYARIDRNKITHKYNGRRTRKV